MSNLPGNPHHDVADAVKREYGLTADKEALNWPLAEMNERLAAIAYEQRTANLLAYMQLGINARVAGVDVAEDVASELAERLGIEVPDGEA